MNEEKYINQFIKERGHSWEKGFYVELQTGDVLFKSSEEYKKWVEDKKEEYKNKIKDEKI